MTKCNCCKQYSSSLQSYYITPRYGSLKYNIIYMCYICCNLASYYWKTNCRDWDEGKHPDDLYTLINSSRQKALAQWVKNL